MNERGRQEQTDLSFHGGMVFNAHQTNKNNQIPGRTLALMLVFKNWSSRMY